MAVNSKIKPGIDLYNQRKYSDSLAFFLSLPEDSSSESVDNIELAYYIGLCYAKLEHYDDALLYLEQVVTSSDDADRTLQCRYILAVIYALSGRKRLADFELNKLLDTGYKTASVYASLAFISYEQNEIEKCLDYYKKALSIEPDNITALNGIGYVLAVEDRDLTAALAYCKKAVSFSPNNGACLDSLGFVYYKLGLLSDSKKFLTKAREQLPNNQEILSHLVLLDQADF